MSELLARIAARRRPVIGMIALPPLAGSSRYRGGTLGGVRDAARRDAELLVAGGFELLMLQNLGDLPVALQAQPVQIAWMTRLAADVRRETGVPVGLNLLENDAVAMLAVASAAELDFVRIKVYVGAMVTASGIEDGRAHTAVRARNACGADTVAIFADVHDRTGVPVASAGLADDVRAAVALGGADGIVLTGRTSDETFAFLTTARATLGAVPLLVGGGVSAGNVAAIMQHADGAIVSSALKTGDSLFGELDPQKIRAFTAAVAALPPVASLVHRSDY